MFSIEHTVPIMQFTDVVIDSKFIKKKIVLIVLIPKYSNVFLPVHLTRFYDEFEKDGC